MAFNLLYIDPDEADGILMQNYLNQCAIKFNQIDILEDWKSALNYLQANDYTFVLFSTSSLNPEGLSKLKQYERMLDSSCQVLISNKPYDPLFKEALALGIQDVVEKSGLNALSLERSLRLALERTKILLQKTDVHRSVLAKVERLQLIDEKPKIYVLRTDLEGRYTYYNDAFAKTFLHRHQSVIGEFSLLHILEEDHQKTFEVVKKCMSSPGEVFRVNLRKPGYLPGTVVKTTWEFIGLTNGEGTLMEIQCTGFDLKQSVQTQLDLQSSLKFQRKILNSDQNLYLITDTNGLIINASGAWDKLLGLNPDDVQGMELSTLVNLSSRQELIEFYKEPKLHLRGLELAFKGKNESDPIISFTVDREKNNYILIGRDITAEKQERQLKLEELRLYMDVLNGLDLSILVCRVEDSLVLFGNNHILKSLGYNKKDLFEKQLDASTIWADEKERLTYRELIDSRAKVQSLACTWLTKSGQKKEIVLDALLENIAGDLCEVMIARESSLIA